MNESMLQTEPRLESIPGELPIVDDITKGSEMYNEFADGKGDDGE